MSEDKDNPDNDVICPCSGTRRSRVRELYLQGVDVQGIAARTGALTGCGGCEWDIEEFLKEITKTREDKPASTSSS